MFHPTRIVKPHRLPALVLIVAAMVALGADAGVGHAQGASGVAAHPFFGTKAPSFRLESVAGDTVSLDSLRGEYVVLHFAATW